MMTRSLKRLRVFLTDPIRAAVTLAVIGLGIFVGIGVYQAGLETPAVPIQPPTQLDKGNAEGRRVTGQSWSFDYDSVRMTPDGAIADIDGVHDGLIYRYGKPFLRMQAKHVTVNTQTNDFNAVGLIRIEQIDKKYHHHRTFKTDLAAWSASTQTLTLPHPSIVSSDGAKLSIGKVVMDFRTGDSKIGAMHGGIKL